MNKHVEVWTEPSTASPSVGCIRLNRPQALHAMDQSMVRDIIGALKRWRDDTSVGLVLVDHAPGSRGFCAGGDIRKLAAAPNPETVSSFVADECAMAIMVYAFPKPYIAIMDGVVMGAGLGLAVHGSHRIATQNTRLAMPEVGIGLFPDTGAAWHLARLPDHIGTWMAMTGARLTGTEALEAGLATHFVPAERIETARKALAADGPDALAQYAVPLSDGAGFSTERRACIASCFAGDDVASIMDALNASDDAWAAGQARIIADKCPASVEVALRYLRGAASGGDFRAMMRTEYALVCAMADRADFREGVRAAIIDKDGTPKWCPARLEDVSEALVADIFAHEPTTAFDPNG